MSAVSYFDGLVARARGEAPLLTPRRTSRFESTSPAERAILEPEGQAYDVPRPPAPPTPPGQPPPVKTVGERGPDRAPEHPFKREQGPIAEADSRAPRTGDRTRPEPVQDEPPRHERKRADDSPPRTIEREVRETHLKELRVERILPTLRESETNRRLPPERREEIDSESPLARRDTGGRFPKLNEIDQRLKALERHGASGHAEPPATLEPSVREVMRETRREHAPGRTLAPRITRAAREPSRPPAVDIPGLARSEPEPVVQVSIGRIEVRASAPDKPVRARGLAKPRLSLDDYLRQREGN